MDLWHLLSEDDLNASLSQAEIEAFRQSGGPGGDDPVETQLAQTAAFVRGIIASSPQTVRADSRALAIPPSLVQPAMDHLRFRLLTRLDISVNESRRLAYEKACEIFDEIRAGRMSVEPGTDEDAGSEVARSPLASNKHPPRFLD